MSLVTVRCAYVSSAVGQLAGGVAAAAVRQLGGGVAAAAVRQLAGGVFVASKYTTAYYIQ